VGQLTMSLTARVLWESHYERLTTPPPGVLGKVTSRAAPHTIRLAELYALFDRSAVIVPDHLLAALALWDAAARSTAFIWGDSTGNKNADRILAALREAPGGLTRSEIQQRVFSNHVPAAKLKAAIAILLNAGLIRKAEDIDTGGAPAQRYFAATLRNAN
jgi:hypothetical protein